MVCDGAEDVVALADLGQEGSERLVRLGCQRLLVLLLLLGAARRIESERQPAV
jgi:hypothetical protein